MRPHAAYEGWQGSPEPASDGERPTSRVSSGPDAARRGRDDLDQEPTARTHVRGTRNRARRRRVLPLTAESRSNLLRMPRMASG